MAPTYISPSALRGGDHAYAQTRSDDDLGWLARSFVEASDLAGTRAIYLSEGPAEETAARLGLPIPSRASSVLVKRAALVLAPGGRFEPVGILAAIEDAADDARRDGFSGASIFVETGWTLGQIQDANRRSELEAIAHDVDVIRRGDATFVCQYPEDRFPPEALERAMGSHPVVVTGGSGEIPASASTRVRREDDVLYVSGELDRGTAHLIAAACRDFLDRLTVDLAETTFFDVGAYRALRTLAETGCRVTLRNASPVVRRVVEILNDQPGGDLQMEDGPTLEAAI